jgi:putative membrane protein
MLGLMIGSLRALWPWQSADRELLPVGEWVAPLVALLIGFLVVVCTIIAERYIKARANQ